MFRVDSVNKSLIVDECKEGAFKDFSFLYKIFVLDAVNSTVVVIFVYLLFKFCGLNIKQPGFSY